MRITSYINNVKCQEWGLNLAQGALFDLLNQVQSWAEPIYLDGEVYYWVSRQMIIREIPVAYSKPDTVYRALKFLAEQELINYIKDGSKDCINLTPKGKCWNSEINPSQLGNKSENQSKLGNKSEKTRKNIRKSSEINPTYKTTNNQSTNDQKSSTAEYRLDELLDRGIPEQVANDFVKLRKAKKAPLSLTAIEGIQREADKAVVSLEWALKVCIMKGWQGFDSTWNYPRPDGDAANSGEFGVGGYGQARL